MTATEGGAAPPGPAGPRPGERVRVTGPPRHVVRPTRAGDVDEQTRLGAVYVGSLLRAQRALAVGVLLVLVITLGALPAVFWLAPSLADVEVLGLPLAWLLLGVLAYPWLLALGWVYLRRAERHEAHFVELLEEPPP